MSQGLSHLQLVSDRKCKNERQTCLKAIWTSGPAMPTTVARLYHACRQQPMKALAPSGG
jgi:hypothetical protein